MLLPTISYLVSTTPINWPGEYYKYKWTSNNQKQWKISSSHLSTQRTDTRCTPSLRALSRVRFFPSLKITCVTSLVNFSSTFAPIRSSTHFIAALRLSLAVRTSTYATTPEISTKTECDYLNGWIKKRSHTQKSHPKWWTPEIQLGNGKKNNNKKTLEIFFIHMSNDRNELDIGAEAKKSFTDSCSNRFFTAVLTTEILKVSKWYADHCHRATLEQLLFSCFILKTELLFLSFCILFFFFALFCFKKSDMCLKRAQYSSSNALYILSQAKQMLKRDIFVQDFFTVIWSPLHNQPWWTFQLLHATL